MSLTIKSTLANPVDSANTVKQPKQTIFAGDLHLTKDKTKDMVEQKKAFAQRKAMKLMKDAWEKDNKANDKIDQLFQTKDDKMAEIQDLRESMKKVEEMKSTIQEEYNVASDSEEQKDLELLEKYQDYKAGLNAGSFSESEIDRLRELQDKPRTEYQNKVLEQNAIEGEMKAKKQDHEDKITYLRKEITDAVISQPQIRTLEKATDVIDSIMENASKEVKNILIKSGMDTIDEQIKEEQERADQVQEKKEEQEEQSDKAKEKRKDEEELINESIENQKKQRALAKQKESMTNVEIAQKAINQIIKTSNLTEDDLKGIEIDFNY